MSGTVIEGRKIGRSIGFPTANIKPDDEHKLIPGNGVYAVEVNLGGKSISGNAKYWIQSHSKHDSGLRSIEVHILNFDRDIYGRSISVIFRKRLRMR